MQFSDKLQFDAATVLNQGRRSRQEDAIASEFNRDSDIGFVVLGDGMGGHACGEIASRLVVSEVFNAIKNESGNPERLERRIGDILHAAAIEANSSVGEYTHARPETQGMGTTLLSPVIVRGRLYWISIGDSPLYIFRRNELFRLNHIHTLQGQIDYLVKNKLIDPADAVDCDQNCLTSAIVGYEIAQIDCCETPVNLHDQDILIVASDGLQFLSDEEISLVLSRVQNETAASIGKALMAEITALDHPEQDNIACCIVKVESRPAVTEKLVSPSVDGLISDTYHNVPPAPYVLHQANRERDDRFH